ncbi:MAG: tRNA (adenosine(37)-N6)-threonylcarbamoyltransferase complex ATPase subunit type 1 TsaE [Chloroflexota bacterium]
MSAPLTIISASAEQTRRIGKALGRAAQPGDAFLLDGEFGVGKTVLVQGLAAGLGVRETVASPSFVLMVQHQGRLPLFHVDLYRLDGHLDDEMLDSLDDWRGAGGVCAIEWPGALPADLRAGATVIRIEALGEHERRLTFETSDARLLDAVRQATEAV